MKVELVFGQDTRLVVSPENEDERKLLAAFIPVGTCSSRVDALADYKFGEWIVNRVELRVTGKEGA